MNKTALAFGIGASLILAAGAANAAGTCGAEVATLQQKLGQEQGANATIGATDPGMQQPSPSTSVEGGASVEEGASVEGGASVDSGATAPMDSDQAANTDNSADATVGATDPGVQQPAPEANATTGTTTTPGATTDGATTDGTTTDGSSTTTADSSSSSASTLPAPTVTETSRVGEMDTSAGGHAEAITALKKAQLAADAGDENTCMTELGAAKAALGIQ